MKIFVFGSTQYINIRDIYSNFGHKVYTHSLHKCKYVRWIDNLCKILICKTVYHIGGCDCKENIYLKIAYCLKKKIIVHWIGTDVLLARKKYEKTNKVINLYCINLAVADHLCKELSEIGVSAAYVPIVPDGIPYERLEIPEKHEVLVYLPSDKQDFYGLDMTKTLAREFSHITFHIVANNGKYDEDRLDNMIYEGMLSKEELYKLYARCSILFRYPQHDGLPVMMLEALGMGRTVIHKEHYPFVVVPKDNTQAAVIECFGNVIKLKPKINYDAIEYIDKTYSHENIIKRYVDLDLI